MVHLSQNITDIKKKSLRFFQKHWLFIAGILFLVVFFNKKLGNFIPIILLLIAFLAIFLVLKLFENRRELFIDSKENFDLNCFYNAIDSFEDLRKFIDFLLAFFVVNFNSDSVVLYLYDETIKSYSVRGLRSKKADEQISDFETNNFLIEFLISHKKFLVREDLKMHNAKNARLLEIFDKLDVDVCIPMLIRRELVGFVFLKKKVNSSYDYDAMRLSWKKIEFEVLSNLKNLIYYHKIKSNYFETLEAIVSVLEKKDQNLKGHYLRVKMISIDIAKRLGLSRNEIGKLKIATGIYDIGKLAIRDKILFKKDRLTEKEFVEMSLYPEIGEQIVSHITFFKEIKSIIRQHHERWDGTGYPDKLRGEEIDMLARILHIANAFDVMVTGKSYKQKISVDEAFEKLMSESGTKFDPNIIKKLDKKFFEKYH